MRKQVYYCHGRVFDAAGGGSVAWIRDEDSGAAGHREGVAVLSAAPESVGDQAATFKPLPGVEVSGAPKSRMICSLVFFCRLKVICSGLGFC